MGWSTIFAQSRQFVVHHYVYEDGQRFQQCSLGNNAYIDVSNIKTESVVNKIKKMMEATGG